MNTAINFDNVSFKYGSLPVLENADFTINQGDFISILGPNGGGKTTLAKLILGLHDPDSGRIAVNGKTPRQMRDKIGYVPQYSLFDPNFPVSVKDVVLMGRIRNFFVGYSRRDKDLAAKAMESVGIGDLSTTSFSALSGGQRQRVLIARALATEPEILLLDEPTANVDAAIEYKMSAMLKELKKKMTVLLITHDLGFVSELVDKVVCVNRRVHIHPTSGITEEHIRELYNENMKIVRHDIKEEKI
ncbi:MAG: ABC transporter ATP-binding protein [Spirochaetales bacterium]|nr:ABC transporter ATP-binding protein [Spirochaetales bacterium]